MRQFHPRRPRGFRQKWPKHTQLDRLGRGIIIGTQPVIPLPLMIESYGWHDAMGYCTEQVWLQPSQGVAHVEIRHDGILVSVINLPAEAFEVTTQEEV